MSNYAMYINGQKVGNSKWSKERIKTWCRNNNEKFKNAQSLGHDNEYWFTEQLDDIEGNWYDTISYHNRESYIPGY